MDKDGIFEAVKFWVSSVVVNLNLCPFASYEIDRDSVRFYVSEASSQEQLLEQLQLEFKHLDEDGTIATTLLIHPHVLQDFYDYNEFLGLAEALINDLNLQGVYQIASFHPQYQFADSEANDASNFTNRSPYPMLHILREESLQWAVENYPEDTAEIPQHNIDLLESIGIDDLQIRLEACYEAQNKAQNETQDEE
ncbi:MAG: hypothetical protein COC19_07110 [SAR86 cluster bacterium]|uniref:DUF1415 domain-containing protein n=1 Tax=SAR86 cluster bacterium TaxID=2030880 RepID=A0A2A4MHK7_9GAMM|nr:MAG: hypothetical protein COC19_07110 [SAR86 cluster bacterium]